MAIDQEQKLVLARRWKPDIADTNVDVHDGSATGELERVLLGVELVPVIESDSPHLQTPLALAVGQGGENGKTLWIGGKPLHRNPGENVDGRGVPGMLVNDDLLAQEQSQSRWVRNHVLLQRAEPTLSIIASNVYCPNTAHRLSTPYYRSVGSQRTAIRMR